MRTRMAQALLPLLFPMMCDCSCVRNNEMWPWEKSTSYGDRMY